MQRLLKFSCHNCGAKLAVPLHMSGLSDNCPKCGQVVTSPALPPESTTIVAAQSPGTRIPVPVSKPAAAGAWSAEQLADALRPKEPKSPPVGVAEPSPPKSAAPAPPAPSSPVPTQVPPGESRKKSGQEKPADGKKEAGTSPVSKKLAQPALLPFPPAPAAVPKGVVPAAADEETAADPEPVSPPVTPAPGHQSLPTAPTAPVAPATPAASSEAPGAVNLTKMTADAPAPAPAAPAPAPRAGEVRLRHKLQSRLVEGKEPKGKEGAPLPSALFPTSLPDEKAASVAAEPGMGELMTSQPVISTPPGTGLPPSPDGRPWLHVPLVVVGNSPSRDRRLRLNRIAMLGVACFLLLDLLVVLWFWRAPISSWMSGSDPKGSPAQAPISVAPAPSEAEEPGPVATGEGEGASTTAPVELPVEPMDDPIALPPPAGNEETPVPVAIPVTDYPVNGGSPAPAAIPVQSLPAPEAAMADAAPAADSTPPPSGIVPPMAENPVETPVPLAPLPGDAAVAAEKDSPPPPPAAAGMPGDKPVLVATATVPDAPEIPYGGLPPPPPDMALPNPPPLSEPEPAPEPLVTGPAVTLVTTTASKPRIGKVPPEAQSALSVLQKFLDAPTWQERLPFVQRGTALRSAMESHAAKFGDGPIRAGQIDFVERYVNKGGVPPYCMFELSGGTLEHPVLALVEQSNKNGVKVDWEAFIDFKESLLLKFLENQGAPSQSFRVILRRKHYFDRDVPDVGGKEAFEVKQPHGPYQGHIFVPKGTDLARQLANQLGWGMDMPVIAKLTWRSSGKYHWVEMTAITSYGWRG